MTGAADHWLEVLLRIAGTAPLDLDAVVLGGALPQAAAAVPHGAGTLPPSPRLWERGEEETAAIGIRVLNPLPDPGAVALRLAAAAVERGITPVILSALPDSGFERFGFRVERLSPGAARAAEEAELQAFWNFAIIIDAEDVERLG